jgi:plasmid stabilization system protein ParE
MKVRMLPMASDELAESLAWYLERSPRAAETLWLRVQDAKRSMVLFPNAAPLIKGRARRFILAGFPIDLIYSVGENEIVILAFAHHSRRPGYWKARVHDLH